MELPMQTHTPWLKLFICSVALFGGLGGVLADFSKTHLLNPDWPPHAKFHNAQTMSMGMLLAVITIAFAFWPNLSGRLQLMATAVLGTLYWTSIFCAQFFPGVAFFDPQFEEAEKIMILGHRLTQAEIGFVLVGMVWSFVILALRKMNDPAVLIK
jgi:uncharacterized membrane protein